MYDKKSGLTMIENTIVITGRRRRHDKNFIKIFIMSTEKFLEDFGVLNGKFKLLFYMISIMQNEPMNTYGWIHLETDILLTNLKTTKITYFKYLSSLKKLKYIEQKTSRTPIWHINPDYYRGYLVESKKN